MNTTPGAPHCELPDAWGISARELCDHFAAWVRGELPAVGDVSVNVREPAFQHHLMGLNDREGGAGYLIVINAAVRDSVDGALAGVLRRWREYVWESPGFGPSVRSGGLGLTSKSGERFSVELISTNRLYADDITAPSAVIVLNVHHIQRPIVPVVERRQQLGGGDFDAIQHALGVIDARESWRARCDEAERCRRE